MKIEDIKFLLEKGLTVEDIKSLVNEETEETKETKIEETETEETEETKTEEAMIKNLNNAMDNFITKLQNFNISASSMPANIDNKDDEISILGNIINPTYKDEGGKN